MQRAQVGRLGCLHGEVHVGGQGLDAACMAERRALEVPWLCAVQRRDIELKPTSLRKSLKELQMSG